MKLLFICLLLISCAHHSAKVTTEENRASSFTFAEGTRVFTADLVLPEKNEGKLPLIIIVHEWWGKTPYVQKRAQMLAKAGYAALVVDLFGNSEVASTPDAAKALVGPFYSDPNLGVQRLNRYLELARQDTRLDASKFYAVGYCFGGSQVLNWARSGVELKGVASFHGNLSSKLQMKPNTAIKILVLNGAADPTVPARDIKAFKVEMAKAHTQLIFHSYKGALHAFTNPEATELGKRYKLPIAYNEKADKASWEEFMKFLE